jgi:hypothetical protein
LLDPLKQRKSSRGIPLPASYSDPTKVRVTLSFVVILLAILHMALINRSVIIPLRVCSLHIYTTLYSITGYKILVE